MHRPRHGSCPAFSGRFGRCAQIDTPYDDDVFLIIEFED
jgi:hypothetical protein